MDGIIIYTLITMDIILSFVLSRQILKAKKLKYAVMVYRVLSATIFAIIGTYMITQGKSYESIFAFLISVLFATESYMTTKWKIGKLCPGIIDLLKREK